MPSLEILRRKLRARKRARDRQARRYRKTGEAGHGRAAKGHARAVRKLRRLIRRYISRHPESGTGAWGGSKSIVTNEVLPVARRYGVPVTSRKRAATDPLTIANPSSDHSILSTESYAADLGTYEGSALAYAIAHALGISGYTTGTYASHYITRAGKTFRVQILWAVEGHFDHVHVGIRREG
jgi:hypothetical protein